MERGVTLAEILAAKENRVMKQNALLREFGVPVISFSMNIAGPVKDSQLIRRAFFFGCGALKAALNTARFPILREDVTTASTGCEAMVAVRADAAALKRLCVSIEDATPVGRLFDMDVLDTDGRKLERENERRCLICGKPGRGCASRRLHSVSELQAATRQIIEAHFAKADRHRIAALATNALIEEVRTTPKPGLVDLNNNGSHRDMTVSTFLASAAALADYWEQCVQIGQESAAQSPEETFARLREAGKTAERAMLDATGCINTHKGAIFILGVLCGAIGRLWNAEIPCGDVEAILNECTAMTAKPLRAELAALAAFPEKAQTKGQRLYLNYGMTGVRGEMAAGLPRIRLISLPKFRQALSAGYSRNDAGAIALLALIAQGPDTNMVARGGLGAAEEAVHEASALLARDSFPSLTAIARLDETFIRRNLSPGGCADLLASTYFLYDWSRSFDETRL